MFYLTDFCKYLLALPDAALLGRHQNECSRQEVQIDQIIENTVLRRVNLRRTRQKRIG